MSPKKFFVVLLGVTLAILAAGGAGYYWARTQLTAESSALAAQLATQQADDQKISSLQHLQYQYNQEIVPILPLIDEALPRDKKQTEILAQLQNIAAQTGLQIGSISMPPPTGLPSSVSQTVKAGNVLALPISFQITGSYNQLQSFTEKVETLNRFTNITDLAVAKNNTGPITYTMSVNAYIKP